MAAAASGDSSPMRSNMETMADVGNNSISTNINHPASSSSNGLNDGANATTTTTTTTTNQNGTDAVDCLSSTLNPNGNSNAKQTITAPADSSDNQPGTPQPKMNTEHSESHQVGSQQEQLVPGHNPYDTTQAYATSSSNQSSATVIGHQLYSSNLFSAPNMQMDLNSANSTTTQSQQQQQGNYTTFLNNYEFYQQQQQMQQQQQQQQPTQAVALAHSASDVQSPSVDYLNATSSASPYAAAHSDYIQKQQQHSSGVRYHPYLQAPISAASSLSSNSNTSNNTHAILDAAIATPNVMSPRVASSTSPSSTSNPNMLISGSGSSIGSLSAGNPNSPANTTSAVALQCKKCGFLCTSEVELQEHSANAHGTSPYASSSGYASSPYVKEEHTQQQQQQQQQQVPVSAGQPATVRSGSTQPVAAANNGSHSGEILDLDNQKLYPPNVGALPVMQSPHGFVDPLQSMHTMQQRADINNQWETARNNEALTSYLPTPQAGIEDNKSLLLNSSYYGAAKQSDYGGLDNMNIKSEYPQIIKAEYTANEIPRYLNDKAQFSVSVTAAGGDSNQQHMLPPAVSSSPAEFPSTTTGGAHDVQQQQLAAQTKSQQYRAGSFEPSSSSTSPAIGVNNVSGTKASNWKSNEARRPKTYNCTACNKWFTSSGHLKRHYNTTLHKNAVKASDKPDPATLPISAHHHPTRDPTTKTTRKTANSTSLPPSATALQQPQHPPAPVHPPEPPNSPADYGGGGSMRTSTSSLAQQQHCAAQPPPGVHQPMEDYHQSLAYQHGNYMQTAQATTNALSMQSAAASLTGSASVTNQQLCQQNSNILNGHPNALAGLSVPKSQIITLPMPSSQMRGLLKSSTTPTTIKIESIQTEAAMEEQQLLTAVEDPPSIQQTAYTATGDAVLAVKQENQLPEEQQTQTQTQVVVYQLELETPAEDLNPPQRHHQVLPPMHCPRRSPLTQLEGSQQHHFDQAAEAVGQQHYHITTNNNSTPEPSPLIISPQQYQEHQLQQMEIQDNIYSHTATMLQPQQQQLPPNIMAEQDYSIMHLDINTQLNSTLQQQQLATTIPTMPTITRTINMDNTPANHPIHHQHTMQLVPMEPQSPANMEQQQQSDTIPPNTSTQVLPSHIIHSSNIIPSYQHLQQPASVQLPALEHTLTYHPTIIGNTGQHITSLHTHNSTAEIFTIDAYGNLLSQSQHQYLQQQFITTPEGQILQILPNTTVTAAALYSQTSDDDSYTGQTSPPAGDLPPGRCQLSPQESTETIKISSPLVTTTNNCNQNEQLEVKPKLDKSSSITTEAVATSTTAASKPSKASDNKRSSKLASKGKAKKRNVPIVLAAGSRLLSNGRIKCESCEKDFSRGCYFTQHSKSFHSGEYPFRCQKCGKRYQSEDVYTMHLTRHRSGDKPHKCELCPKQFHHKTDLRRHIESIHTGNKQHICDICEKSFCRKDHLRKHIETHSKPKVCYKRPARKRAKTADTITSTTTATPSKPSAAEANENASAAASLIATVPSSSSSAGSVLPQFNSTPNSNYLFQQASSHSEHYKNKLLLINENGEELEEDYVFVTIDAPQNSDKLLTI